MSKILQVLSGFALVAILALSVGTINVAFALTTPTPTKSVPGPIVGAGLPILGLGYGAYWLVRRYRRKSH